MERGGGIFARGNIIGDERQGEPAPPQAAADNFIRADDTSFPQEKAHLIVSLQFPCVSRTRESAAVFLNEFCVVRTDTTVLCVRGRMLCLEWLPFPTSALLLYCTCSCRSLRAFCYALEAVFTLES